VGNWLDALLPRRALGLLALWPLAAHWRTLLVALCGGALAGAAGAAVAAVWHGRMGLEAADLVIAKYRSSAGPLAALGIATTVGWMLSARTVRAWLGALGAQALLAFQVCALAGRAAALAAVAAVLAVVVRAPSPAGALPRRATIVALAAGAVVAAVLLGGPLRERFSQMGGHDRLHEGEPPANIRMVLWEEAWERGLNHPIVGHGVNAWRATVGQEMAADPAQFGIRKSRAARLSQANHAHNTLLGAWYGTGLVGVALLVGTAVCIVRALWRAAPRGWAEAAALGGAVVYCVDGMFDDLGNVSIGGFLVSLLVLFAAVNGPLRAGVPPRR
jgi:O-antigen ligase